MSTDKPSSGSGSFFSWRRGKLQTEQVPNDPSRVGSSSDGDRKYNYTITIFPLPTIHCEVKKATDTRIGTLQDHFVEYVLRERARIIDTISKLRSLDLATKENYMKYEDSVGRYDEAVGHHLAHEAIGSSIKINSQNAEKCGMRVWFSCRCSRNATSCDALLNGEPELTLPTLKDVFGDKLDTASIEEKEILEECQRFWKGILDRLAARTYLTEQEEQDYGELYPDAVNPYYMTKTHAE